MSGVREPACAASKRLAVFLAAEHAVHVKRFSYTFEFLEPEVLKIKSCPYETPRQFRDEYRVGSGKGL